MTKPNKLSRRERQIMDILYRLEEASAKDVMAEMEDAPSYSSVRTLIGKMVEKGHVAHRKSGLKYVYYPLQTREKASKSALNHLLQTFFDDSPLRAVNSLLDMSARNLSDAELQELADIIAAKKREAKEREAKQQDGEGAASEVVLTEDPESKESAERQQNSDGRSV